MREARMFKDRADAGRQLVAQLSGYRGRDVLVVGIARGGVPVASEVARALDAELDVVVARKLGAPGQPELAIGAVTSNGGRYVNDEYVRELEVTEDYLRAEIEHKLTEARAREARMRGSRPPLAPEGRTVIVVDDGLATGATMRAALRSLRRGHPEHLVMAAPVGSREACDAMREEADEIVCPRQPTPFFAVGLYYEQFGATSDDEVCRLLDEAQAARAAAARPRP